MSTFSQLGNDIEFKKRWPYVWSKLEPHLLAKQREFALSHKGDHEQIGQFVEFLAILMDDLNTIDVEVASPEKTTRPKLHNREFKQ